MILELQKSFFLETLWFKLRFVNLVRESIGLHYFWRTFFLVQNIWYFKIICSKLSCLCLMFKIVYVVTTGSWLKHLAYMMFWRMFSSIFCRICTTFRRICDIGRLKQRLLHEFLFPMLLNMPVMCLWRLMCMIIFGMCLDVNGLTVWVIWYRGLMLRKLTLWFSREGHELYLMKLLNLCGTSLPRIRHFRYFVILRQVLYLKGLLCWIAYSLHSLLSWHRCVHFYYSCLLCTKFDDFALLSSKHWGNKNL